MKNILRIGAAVLALLWLAVPALHARAKSTVFKVGFVDGKKVISQYSGSKDAQKAMAEAESKGVAELKEKDADLEKLKEEFKKKKLMMSDEQKKKAMDEIETKTLELEQAKQSIQQQLANKENILLENLVSKINAAASVVADAKGYDLILDKSAAYYGADDLTDDVIKALENQSTSK